MSCKLSWELSSSVVSCLERTFEQSERQAVGAYLNILKFGFFLILKIRLPSAVNELHKLHQDQHANGAYRNNRCICYESYAKCRHTLWPKRRCLECHSYSRWCTHTVAVWNEMIKLLIYIWIRNCLWARTCSPTWITVISSPGKRQIMPYLQSENSGEKSVK